MKSNRARVLFVVVSLAALASLRAVDSGPGRDPATKALSVFSEVFALTRGNYVDPTDPKTVYVTTSGTSVARNVAGASFAFEEASYLAGMVAGRITRSNILGVIGGTELPPVKQSFEAFEQGAKSVNPNVKILWNHEVAEFVAGGTPEALVGLDLRDTRSGAIQRIDLAM